MAAPLVLDLARMSAFAQSRGEVGAQTQLSVFFKSPLFEKNHDLHHQYHRLMDYVASAI